MSVGAKQFTIPYVYNLDEAKARQKLEDYKLKVKVDYEASDAIPEGSVTRTDPAKDSLVAAGDSVTLWVSTGPEDAQATVPLLTGKTLDEAKSLLKDAGLTLGDVSEESSDKFEKGKIFYQSETAENKVAKGTAIDVTVSIGAASEQTGGDNTAKYVGEVNIDINPFESLGGSKGMIELYMVQDGSDSTPIYEQKTSSGEFPLTFTVESDSNAAGTVTMFVDGKVFKKPGETEAHTWTVNFKPEE
jgi:serine/threonine-protein kinase